MTGANGFIGSNFLKYIKNFQSFKVIATDKQKQFLYPDIPIEKYVKCDLRYDLNLIPDLIDKVDLVFHFGAIVGVENYLKSPMDMFEVNVLASAEIVKLCRLKNKKLFFSSTSEVYGKNPIVPWDENADRVLGSTSIDRWGYSTSKSVIEHLILGLIKSGELEALIFRFFNVYGPNQAPIFFISRSINRVRNGLPLEIFDGGKQTRCFTFVEDVSQILFKLMSVNYNGVVNVGNNEEITLIAMVQLLKEYFPEIKVSNVDKIQMENGKYEDLTRRVPDINQLTKLIGNFAFTPLTIGLEKTLENFL